MPGVQVLFGFLLAVAFQQRFAELDALPAGRLPRHAPVPPRSRRRSSSPPTAYHRIIFRPGREGAASSGWRTPLAIAGLVAARARDDRRRAGRHDFLFGAITAVRHRARLRGVRSGCGSRYGPLCGETRTPIRLSAPAAILDIDGTLVDTNYQHALAWYRAFRQHGGPAGVADPPRTSAWAATSSSQALAGDEVEDEHGDDIRAAEKALVHGDDRGGRAAGGRPRAHRGPQAPRPRVVLASSAKADEIEHYLDLLDARDLADGWTSSADVEAPSPSPTSSQSPRWRRSAAARR